MWWKRSWAARSRLPEAGQTTGPVRPSVARQWVPAPIPLPRMKLQTLLAAALVTFLGSCGAPSPSPAGDRRAVDGIDTLVVIYAENRSFDTFYGLFPGANGIPGLNPSAVGRVSPQRDVDGAVLPVLPPVWGGLTSAGQVPVVTQAQ